MQYKITHKETGEIQIVNSKLGYNEADWVFQELTPEITEGEFINVEGNKMDCGPVGRVSRQCEIKELIRQVLREEGII